MPLEQQRDALAGLWRHRCYLLPEYAAFPTLRTEESHEDVYGGGFSGAVFPKQPQDAPLRDIEAQPLIDEAAAPVALCEVSDRYDVVHKLIGE